MLDKTPDETDTQSDFPQDGRGPELMRVIWAPKRDCLKALEHGFERQPGLRAGNRRGHMLSPSFGPGRSFSAPRRRDPAS